MEYKALKNLDEVKYLKYSDFDAISRNIYFPLRSICMQEKQFMYFPDGNMTQTITYSIYPEEIVGEIPLLNAYGQMMFNSYMKKHNNQNQQNNQNDSIDYSSL